MLNMSQSELTEITDRAKFYEKIVISYRSTHEMLPSMRSSHALRMVCSSKRMSVLLLLSPPDRILWHWPQRTFTSCSLLCEVYPKQRGVIIFTWLFKPHRSHAPAISVNLSVRVRQLEMSSDE